MEEVVYHSNFEQEDTYWWFLARNVIVEKIIKRKCKLNPGETVLDVGCGTGGFAKYISKDLDVIALDTSKTALEYCKKRGLKTLYNSTLDEFPSDKHDVKAITMLDVVEHIDDDLGVLKDAYSVLDTNGYLIVSVPAYQWLWSHHDVVHMHKRRYKKKEIVSVMKNAGFQVEYASFFNTFLFLPAVLKRFADKITGNDKSDSPVEEVSPGVNKLFKSIFSSESRCLPGLSFPFGLSIIVIAKKV